MQLRSRTITSADPTTKRPNDNVEPKTSVCSAPTPRKSKRSPAKHDALLPDDAPLELSENGVRHAIRYADRYMESHNTSLHAHFIADGKRLYRRLNDADVTTRSGANSKRIRQNEFDAFVRFVQNEAGVDITEDVK